MRLDRVILTLAFALGVAGCDAYPCEGINCSGHGSCMADGLSPFCECDEGYLAVGLSCLPESEADPCLTADCPAHTDCVAADAVARCEPVFAIIASGTFIMGSPEAEAPLRRDEDVDEEHHEVWLTHDYELLINEVTRFDFVARMGFDPSEFAECPDCPVGRVTWSQAAAYCNALSERAGLDNCYLCEQPSDQYFDCQPRPDFDSPYECPGYRLPTEAEWEYAVRAGTDGPTYNDTSYEFSPDAACSDGLLDEIAWYCGNADNQPHPVATRTDNAWGLFDMLGNVAEWCHDYHGDYSLDPVEDPFGPPTHPDAQRVFRGGGFDDDRRRVRAAARDHAGYDASREDIGFRVARTLTHPADE